MQKRTKLLSSAFVMVLLPLLISCGKAGQQNQAGGSDPLPPLPTSEAHGSMHFTDVVGEPVVPTNTDPNAQAGAAAQTQTATGTNQSGTAAATSTETAKPVDTSGYRFTAVPQDQTPGRQPLCQDSYKPGHAATPGLTCPRCMSAPYKQKAVGQAKLDILIVADTSPSIETQRIGIAKGLQEFVSQLPGQTDYQIAVMAAHSDVSYDPQHKPSTGLAGKLYRAGQEPVVLRPADFKNRDGSANMAALSRALHSKLTHMPLDAATDGGEVGLYSLDKGISEPLLSYNRDKLGFFRKDAALAVIFISDENDICSYGVNYPEGITPKANVNRYLNTQFTVEEKANQFYCRDAEGKPTVTSRSVFLKLRALKQIAGSDAAALLVSGIVYTEPGNVPTVVPPLCSTGARPCEDHPEYFTEKEVGYGYIDIIHDNNGLAVDISKANFNEGLKQIGQAAALKLQKKSEFILNEGQVDPNTICVTASAGPGKPVHEINYVEDFTRPVDGLTYTYNKDLREVQFRMLGQGKVTGDLTDIEVFYCEPPSALDFNPEQYLSSNRPTSAEHYRSLPVPNACQGLKKAIRAGQLDQVVQ